MKIRPFIFAGLVGFFGLFSPLIYAMSPSMFTPGQADTGQAPELSPEDKQALEEMNALFDDINISIEGDITEKTAGMSEAEREQFKEQYYEDISNQVEDTYNRMSERMDQMIAEDPSLMERLEKDPNAFEQFMTELIEPEIARVEQEELAKQEIEKPTPTVAEKPVPEKPSKPQVIDYNKKAAIIDEICEQLGSFLQKSGIGTTISDLYHKWKEEGRLRTKELTWDAFKEKVELLKQNFEVMKGKKSGSKEYIYMKDLVADEKLWKAIEQFEKELINYVPLIKIPTGSTKISSASKDATREAINTCLRNLSNIDLLDKLMEVRAKYDPEFKKIKEAEEKARQQAAISAQQPRRSGYVVEIGKEDRGYAPSPEYADYGRYPSGPSYRPYDQRRADMEKPSPREPGKPTPSDTKAPEKPTTPTKDKKEKSEDIKKLDSALETFFGIFDDISELIETNKNVANLKRYMLDRSYAKEELQNVSATLDSINGLIHGLEKAVSAAHRAIRYVDAGTKNEYSKEFLEAVQKSSEAAQLRKLIGTIGEIEKQTAAVLPEKKYVFFGEEANLSEDVLQHIAQQQLPPQGKTSIFGTRDRYKGLIESISGLAKVTPRKKPARRGADTRQSLAL